MHTVLDLGSHLAHAIYEPNIFIFSCGMDGISIFWNKPYIQKGLRVQVLCIASLHVYLPLQPKNLVSVMTTSAVTLVTSRFKMDQVQN
jgi:hypothetical protein